MSIEASFDILQYRKPAQITQAPPMRLLKVLIQDSNLGGRRLSEMVVGPLPISVAIDDVTGQRTNPQSLADVTKCKNPELAQNVSLF